MKKLLFTACTFSNEEIESLKNIDIEIQPADADLSEEELIKELRGCQGYIIGGSDKATRKVIESTDLEIIVFYGTGYENYVDMAAANEKHIQVSNTPKANAYSVAEYTMALILNAVKQISYLNKKTKEGEWLRRQSWNLQGKTLGIVGMGTIGTHLARIMKNAFGMTILYTSRTQKSDVEKELDAKKVDIDHLMSESDVVSVHASYTEEISGMIGERELERMRPHSILVNAARAGLVDGLALSKALKNGNLATAVFDGYYEEPSPSAADDKWGLLDLEDNQFIITPHTAYNSKESLENMNKMVIDNLRSFTKDGKAIYSVN